MSTQVVPTPRGRVIIIPLPHDDMGYVLDSDDRRSLFHDLPPEGQVILSKSEDVVVFIKTGKSPSLVIAIEGRSLSINEALIQRVGPLAATLHPPALTYSQSTPARVRMSEATSHVFWSQRWLESTLRDNLDHSQKPDKIGTTIVWPDSTVDRIDAERNVQLAIAAQDQHVFHYWWQQLLPLTASDHPGFKGYTTPYRSLAYAQLESEKVTSPWPHFFDDFVPPITSKGRQRDASRVCFTVQEVNALIEGKIGEALRVVDMHLINGWLSHWNVAEEKNAICLDAIILGEVDPALFADTGLQKCYQDIIARYGETFVRRADLFTAMMSMGDETIAFAVLPSKNLILVWQPATRESSAAVDACLLQLVRQWWDGEDEWVFDRSPQTLEPSIPIDSIVRMSKEDLGEIQKCTDVWPFAASVSNFAPMLFHRIKEHLTTMQEMIRQFEWNVRVEAECEMEAYQERGW